MQLQWLPTVFTIAVCLQSQQYLCSGDDLNAMVTTLMQRRRPL
jgi:hypothetical protein